MSESVVVNPGAQEEEVMADVNAGRYTLGPDHGSVVLRTARDGLAARVGHDLVLEIVSWQAMLDIPSDGAPISVEATFDARSLEVRSGTGGAVPLSDKDKGDIRRNAFEKVFRVETYPIVTFASTAITQGTNGRFEVAGELTIVGVPRRIRFEPDLRQGDGAVHVTAVVPIVQSEWGITPFRAFMGALRVRDQVEVAIDIRVPMAALSPVSSTEEM